MFSMRLVLLVVALICAVNGRVDEQYKTVETLNGPVRGIRETTLLKGIPFYAFKGVPYAKPPIGDLRFKAPEPVESWTNSFDAFEHGNTCVQPRQLIPNQFPQSEDCLSLNVYVPAHAKPAEKLAVLFFIHGGGYAEGASNFYGPDFIVEKQAIVVTINYRLGLLGFLSLDTPEYSGNMGLKDQQLALKWISVNIEQFGGDSKRITIFGESAGGSSIHFHILSTESRKYFRNAIPMSGVIDNYWAMSVENDHLELAHKIATELGEPKNTYDELVGFLKAAPADKLSAYSTVLGSTTLFEVPFAPVIERQDAKRPFLIESSQKIYETTQIDFDVLFTTTSAEFVGLMDAAPPLKDLLNNKFELPLPFRGLKLPTDDHRILTNKIREFYFDGSGDTLKQYVDMLSDTNFGYEIDKTVKTHAAKSKGRTFYAVFSMDSKLNGFKRRNPQVANVPGTSHFDEIFYLFRYTMDQSLYDEVLNNRKDKESKICLKIIDNMTTLFTNFAKYGELSYKNNLNIQVQPVQSGNAHFLEVNNGGLTSGLNPKKAAYDFLASIEQQAISVQSLMQRDEL